MEKKILDATCGSRMMWFDKWNNNALFCDKRTEDFILCDGRTLSISPDLEVDFRSMPFADETFYLVVFDPPHLKSAGETSWIRKKYGMLTSDWRSDLKVGFNECMRVLKKDGTLIFKWNEDQIKTKEILEIIGETPLFGHPTGNNGKTIWMTFMKY